MSSTDTGRKAENVAAKYLEESGYEIIAQNWRTRWCEIDIVAKKKKIVYFIEIKYRKSNAYGGGLEYITTTKQRKMDFSAKMWVSEYHWQGDYRLSAIEVSGQDFIITEFIEEI